VRFEQQVQRYPYNIAVKTSHQALTYTVLNQNANQLARALVARHGPAPQPVVLLISSSILGLTALIGSWKADKFYAALNPAWPVDRLRLMLDDVQAAAIIADHTTLALATHLAPPGCQVLNLETLDGQFDSTNLNLPLTADHAAGLFYTSGSTGQPKGLLNSHRNVLHRAMVHSNVLHTSAADRLTLLASWSFSSSLNNICGALFNGATLLPFDLQQQTFTDFTAWLKSEAITLYHSVPTVFRRFTSTLQPDEIFPALRVVTLSGEPLLKIDVERYKRHCPPDCLLLHRFSTSETGSISQMFLDHATPLTDKVIPVGYATDGKEVLLLDAAGHAVGVGDIGEIVIKSRYMSPGYWRQPERTQQKFSPAPEGGDMRLCYTGDLGRRRPDGCLEHLGRRDTQVKIRGQRVDVLEVELALLAHPAVKEAAVTERADRHGDLCLVACLVPAVAPTPPLRVLRSFLQTRLPAFMIPAAMQWLEAIPLTYHSKVNRRALPDPDWTRSSDQEAFVAPRSPFEHTVAQLWAEVLGLAVAQVSVHDHFTDLGGHSLLATQLVTRLRHTFQADLPMRTLLEAGTVADMSRLITQHLARQLEPEALEHLLGELETRPEDHSTSAG
jgi:amino acid adenylation domain-containing protein